MADNDMFHIILLLPLLFAKYLKSGLSSATMQKQTAFDLFVVRSVPRYAVCQHCVPLFTGLGDLLSMIQLYTISWRMSTIKCMIL